MLTITKLFEKAFQTMERRKWDKIYIVVDIHETILEPTWSIELSHVYYPYAKEALKLLTQRRDVYLIQWSSSNPENNQAYYDLFKKDDIYFDAINENLEVGSTEYADFDSKIYMNVGLDDKFGFEPADWKELYYYLLTLNS